MSVDAYIKQAVSDLTRAVDDKHREINDMRAELTRKDHTRHKEVDRLERKIHNQEADLVLYNNGVGESAWDIKEIVQMKRQIKQVQRTFEEDKKQLEEDISRGEELKRELEAKVNELRHLSG